MSSACRIWAIGAAVARFPDTEEVTGSIPVSPTQSLIMKRKPPVNPGVFCFSPVITGQNGCFGPLRKPYDASCAHGLSKIG